MKPILFNTAMVKTILDGRKAQTRRAIKPQPDICHGYNLANPCGNDKWESIHTTGMNASKLLRPKYQPGNILWVRETWQHAFEVDGNDRIVEGTGKYIYFASPEDWPRFTHWVDSGTGEHRDRVPWRPSIHMPRAAARLFLRVKSVRPERVQDITKEDAIAEGAAFYNPTITEVGANVWQHVTAKARFYSLWDSTIKKSDLALYGWASNPWVWVYEFERIEKPKEAQ